MEPEISKPQHATLIGFGAEVMEQDLQLRGSRGQPPTLPPEEAREQPSFVLGKPSVKRNAISALTDDAKKRRFPSKNHRSRPAGASHHNEILTKMSRI
jgi:hypothetical protein